MNKTTITLTTLIAFAALPMLSCNSKEGEDASSNKSKAVSPTLIAVIDAKVEAEASDIHIIRKTAKPGDTITVTGWIMGNMSPFVEGRAAFMLGDPKVVTACNVRPDDHCSTPWDVCCDDPADIKRATATIQIVDADGRVLKEGIEGVEGIEKLSKLLVTGIVAEGSSEDSLVINASAIDLQ